MPLTDRFGRIHDDLRISVTDRCNLRCSYCMPEEPVWFPRKEILSFEEITRLVGVAASLGVRKLRLTGGEPLLRKDLPKLVRLLHDQGGCGDLSLTTNGLLLGGLAASLAEAGLRRVNVSLDTLDPETYAETTRRDRLQRVLEGLEAASRAGLSPIKINAVLTRERNEHEVGPLVERAREQGWELRFIEYMPLENGGSWNPERVVTGEEVRRRIEARWPLIPDPTADPSSPATRFLFEDGGGAVGFIDSVTRPFCSTCSRLRLTADGKLRVCLYDDVEVDLKAILRDGGSDEELAAAMQAAVLNKGRGGALEILERKAAIPLKRTMHQIGG